MNIPPPEELMARLRLLPAGKVLLECLGAATPVYLVGGAVRDLLLGLLPSDLDLVVDGDAHSLARQLDPGAKLHDRFGTATFTVNGFAFDIARTRRERYPHPGALPEVEPAGLEEDLLRRDFTVNAIAMAMGQPEPGSIISAPGALDDLRARQLRVLHDASFLDDPTRLIRLVRYRSRLGFDVEARTRRLAAEAIIADALNTVSGDRIGAELRLLAREDDPVAALEALERFGLAQAIHPRFGLADEARARSALAILDSAGRRDLLALAFESEAIPADELAAFLDELGFEALERKTVLVAATGARPLAERLAAARRPSEIAAAVTGSPPELVAAAGALGPEEQARRWLHELRAVRLEIDGADLLAAGVPEGPAIGRGLRAALLAKLDGRVQGREQELACALREAADSQ